MNLKKISVILTDDDKEEHHLFKDALSELPHPIEFQSFHNGNDLLLHLENCQDAKPDFLFLDLNMPLITGLQCLEKIRQNTTFDSLPVIIYSTSNREKDIEDTFALGADLYVSKPTNYSEMQQIFDVVFHPEFSQTRTNRVFENYFKSCG